MQRLLRSPPTATYVPSLTLTTAIAPVKSKTQKSEEKILILSEVPNDCVEDVLQTKMDFCDIACLMYDVTKPETFKYVTDIQKKLPPSMKVIYIANKSDLLQSVFEYE